jgi:hypothetical protein
MTPLPSSTLDSSHHELQHLRSEIPSRSVSQSNSRGLKDGDRRARPESFNEEVPGAGDGELLRGDRSRASSPCQPVSEDEQVGKHAGRRISSLFRGAPVAVSRAVRDTLQPAPEEIHPGEENPARARVFLFVKLVFARTTSLRRSSNWEISKSPVPLPCHPNSFLPPPNPDQRAIAGETGDALDRSGPSASAPR